jgi:hypothetical protein
LKLKYVEPLSNVAVNFNLRRYNKALLEALMHARSGAGADCTLPHRADNLDGNGCGSTGCGACKKP